jgi:hypothetical protein
MAKSGGYTTRDDLTRYRTGDRDALRGTYRGSTSSGRHCRSGVRQGPVEKLQGNRLNGGGSFRRGWKSDS